MSDEENILIVSGANGTATSLVLAMLNARPDIFLLYEVRPYHRQIGKYARRFLRVFPDVKPIFRSSTGKGGAALEHKAPVEIFEKYELIQAKLREHGHKYRYFGDKVPTLESDELTSLSEAPYFIFTARDIRTWLCREKIFRRPGVIDDVVPISREYLSMYLRALEAEHSLVLRTEDCILENRRVMAQLIDYLGLPDQDFIEAWWDHVIPEDGSPKAACHWYGQGRKIPRKSAGLKPIELDVEFELRPHRFWDLVLPVFDKYYGSADRTHHSPAEIAADRRFLEAELAEMNAPLSELFGNFTSWKFAHDDQNRPTRRNIWRLTENGRLHRPDKETPQVKAAAAESLIKDRFRPLILMIEQEDEPSMAVKHANLFTNRPFKTAMNKAGAIVIRLNHETAKSTVPELASKLQPPLPSYFARRAGGLSWSAMPYDFTLENLIATLGLK